MDLNTQNCCIVLTRVSTNQQDYTAQVDDLTNWANSLGFTNIKVISTKESGFKTFDLKEGFKQVVDFISCNKEYKTILVTELSRLSRRQTVLFQIKQYLVDNKIQLFVKDISFSLFDANGMSNFATDIIFNTFASMTEHEMNTKKVRFRRELDSLQAKGISITGKELFGYRREYDETIRKNRFVINEHEANEIRTIYNWYLYGIDGDKTKCNMKDINIACISKGFSRYLHSKRNVTKALGERAYIGHKITNNWQKNTEYWSYGDKTKEKYVRSHTSISYPRILSDELFNSVQEKKLRNNTTADKCNKHITLLSKLIKCPMCGLYLGGNYRYINGYVAHSYRCTRRQMAINCSFKGTYSMALLDSAIWCYIKGDITNLVDKMQRYYRSISTNSINKEIENLKNKINELENDKRHEVNIYRVMSKSDENKAYIEFCDKVSLINNEIEILKNKISDKAKLIERIELNRRTNNERDLKKEIQNIENDKSELKKYINLFVKEINILYNSVSYLVLNVSIIKDVIKSTIKIDSMEIDTFNPYYNTYIIIDKHDNNRIKMRCISGDICKFENDCFVINRYNIFLNEIFTTSCIDTNGNLQRRNRELNNEEIRFFCSLNEVNYRRLNVYNNE